MLIKQINLIFNLNVIKFCKKKPETLKQTKTLKSRNKNQINIARYNKPVYCSLLLLKTAYQYFFARKSNCLNIFWNEPPINQLKAAFLRHFITTGSQNKCQF